MWAVLYLADNQEIQMKLRSHLQSIYNLAYQECREPSVTDITQTTAPYLEAVIEEILRCSTVVPLLSRMSKHNTTLLGHMIPKGTTIMFVTNGPDFLQPGIPVPEEVRSESSKNARDRVGTWSTDDISIFKPERWIEKDENGEDVFNASKGPMLPFGGGTRGCFGRRLAYLELRVVLLLLVWNFEFLPLPEKLRSYRPFEKITVETVRSPVRLKKLISVS
jgi:cytochrome P450